MPSLTSVTDITTDVVVKGGREMTERSTVLLVDDDGPVRNGTLTFLRKDRSLRYEGIGSLDALSASIRSLSPVVVIIRLADSSAVIAKWLEQNSARPLPAFIVVGHPPNRFVDEMLQRQYGETIAAVLHRPLDLRDLAEHLNHALATWQRPVSEKPVRA